MTDEEDGSVIPNLVVKNNGIPIGTTNKRGDVFFVSYNCVELHLSGELPPYYKLGELKTTLKNTEEHIKLKPFKVS